MLNKDIYILKAKLSSKISLKSLEVNYAIIKNKQLIAKEIEVLAELIKSEVPGYLVFEQEVSKLRQEFEGIKSKEDLNFQEEQKKLIDKMTGLDKKHKEDIKLFNEFLLKENKLELVQINKSDVPKDITTEELELIFELIVS